MKTPSEIIQSEIENSGILPFARFMELALYAPETGYYETGRGPGREGDFYTSVSVGELFGQLLAFQFAEWLLELPSGCPLSLMEAGAHDGALARDILGWFRSHRPELFERLQYIILEPSPRRHGWQKETLGDLAGKICWTPEIAGLKDRFYGVIFSNELLDAFPVHRLGWDAKAGKWFEWGVGLNKGEFAWARMTREVPASSHPTAPPELLAVLPDQYTVEVSPSAGQWWGAAAGVLKQGKLLAIDYGLTDDELFLPSRKNGTLRAYFKHHATDNVLANAGEQDLTAHVNFSMLRAIGESQGLATGGLVTQSQFLTRILEKTTRSQVSFGEWTPARTRQFQTLTHPEHLGRSFRVFVQSRDARAVAS
ncbi:MAG TPA: SAM-dependent methyltransferase [Verrucomicrobiae bacterium]|jgi:SAM-dependent MidA family methyltransferase